MERTIGTISGGVLGLTISLLGHGFGQDSDMVFTGVRLPSTLQTKCCRILSSAAAPQGICSLRA